MIIKKVGIQITTTFALGRRKTQFVAWERIHDIVINEAITLVCISFRLFQMIIHDLSFFFSHDSSDNVYQQLVLFYLAILLQSHNQNDNPEGIVPVFQVFSFSLPMLTFISTNF